ncbi:MAG TPA: hypothetical protein VL588_09865 [Bdellovibrionota bacterium]|jgi:hypothetical protein|nr:hypothetical protein [Bdellovibrionota bacterium]
MSDDGQKQSGIPETFEGKKVVKHPYLLYGILNLLALGFMALVGWLAWNSGLIPGHH